MTSTPIPAEVRDAPRRSGRLELIVARPSEGTRRVLADALLDEERGLVGDSWADRGSRSGPPEADRQLGLMSSRAAAWLLGDPDRWPEAGDQLFVDLDLGVDHLPPGTRLAVGGAEITITEAPHLGCAKFRRRFGEDVLRTVNGPEGRALRLRGVHARVHRGGTIRRGDPVEVLPPDP